MSYAKPPRFCTNCGADSRDGADISYNGLCHECGIRKSADAIVQINARQGPAAKKWLEGMARYASRRLELMELSEQAERNRKET